MYTLEANQTEHVIQMLYVSITHMLSSVNAMNHNLRFGNHEDVKRGPIRCAF